MIEQNDSNISRIVTSLMSSMDALNICYFAHESGTVPPLAFQVDFPRLEIVLTGEICDGPFSLRTHDLLYVPAGSWNCPLWEKPATTLSILFGKQQLGFSVQRWDGQQLQTASRSQALFEAIRDHIDAHYAEALSRDAVAQAFYISPNYLSHLFNKSGALGFNEYLNYTRLEKAKALLKGYDLKVKEVAHACGFTDSNYFCRLFSKNTDRSPSEYRRQYHSQLLAKE